MKSSRDIRGGSELTSFRTKARGTVLRAALSKARSAGSPHCPLLQPHPHPASRHQILKQLTPFAEPCRFPAAQPEPLSGAFPHSGLPRLTQQTFLKRLKGPQTPSMQQRAVACPAPPAKRPQVRHQWQPASVCSSLSQAPPGPVQAATICSPLCGSYQVAPVALACTRAPPLPSGPRTHAGSGQLHTTAEHRPTTAIRDTPKGQTGQHRSPAKVNPAPWGHPCMTACPLWSQPVPASVSLRVDPSQ